MSESRLPVQIREQSGRIRELLLGLSAQANALRGLRLCDEAAEACTAMRVDLTCAVAALNALDACVGAAAMTGGMVEEPRAKDMELHPVNRGAMLRSLHRCNDHSMDPEREEGGA